MQGFTTHVQGWLGRLVLPSVHWYVPYFNAYAFILARSDDYQAEAASADRVGAGHAAHALKRVNLLGLRHRRFMAQTFERIAHDALPPPDLAQRWAAAAAERWFGARLPALRAELASTWAAHVDVDDALEPHRLDEAAMQTVRGLLDAAARRDVRRIFLARRVIAADASARQWLVGAELIWWGRRRGREAVVLQRLAALDGPVPLRLIVLGRAQRPLHRRLEALAGARLG